jgi:hypothetical protein
MKIVIWIISVVMMLLGLCVVLGDAEVPTNGAIQQAVLRVEILSGVCAFGFGFVAFSIACLISSVEALTYYLKKTKGQ